MTTRRRRGMTLTELLVTSGVLLLLTGVLYTMLLYAQSAWVASAVGAESYEGLEAAVRRMAGELRNSAPDRVTALADASGAFAFGSAEDRSGTFQCDGAGAPSWQKFVVYYRLAGRDEIRRREIYGSTSTALSATDLQAACDGTGQVVARGATRLLLVPSGRFARLTVQVEAATSRGTRERLAWDTSAYLRN